MSYATAELRLLTDRLVADGMNHWSYDTADSMAAVLATGYFADGGKVLSVSNGRGMALGDKVTVRRWADLSTKTTILSVTEHHVNTVNATTGVVTISGTQDITNIIDDALAVTLTPGQSGGTVVLNKTDGVVVTLPAAAAGLHYDFVIAADAASVGYKVICAAGDFIVGSLLMDDGDTGLTTTAAAFNGTTHLAIDINAATDGWLAGGRFSLRAISDTQWLIDGHVLHTGNVSSPAATS